MEKTKLPSILLDSDGYPTDEWIDYIKTFVPDNKISIMTFIKEILPNGWYMADWGIRLNEPTVENTYLLELHTGGWGGNELTIDAMLSNPWFTRYCMILVATGSGGHYYFDIFINDEKDKNQPHTNNAKLNKKAFAYSFARWVAILKRNLNEQDGLWWKEQLKHFENVIFPIYKSTKHLKKIKKFLKNG